jgi:DNA repair ATPase RecN
MFIKKQTNRIDELVKQKEALLSQKEFNTNKKNEINARYGIKIKRLENKCFKVQEQCDNDNYEIDRELRRIAKMIELEREHANSVADLEKKPEFLKK